ncbi:MAG: hypothetical protein JSS64_00440 [Bacteroidetes bacterium]|nr:hypothetical protein [Bacteroidota bacterium]
MPILVRRINRAKWEQIINEDDASDSSADAITNCLKTTNNDLSVWKIENIEQLGDAILALITGGQQTKLSTLHYVLIREDVLLERGLNLAESEGDTRVESLKNNHRDIANLTYNRLGIVKNIILDCLAEDTNKEAFFTRAKLKVLLKKAIDDGKVNKEDLNKELIENEKL